MRPNELKAAIDDGNETHKEIADYLDLDHRHVAKYAKKHAENDETAIERERGASGFTYSVVEQPAQSSGSTMGEDYPVDRDYNWDEYVPDPSTVDEYVPTNGEWDQINAQVDLREQTQKPARALIGGPTGCGKTTLAENIAAERGWPLFTIQVRYSMDEADLLGSPALTGGETRWKDGVLTKALLCSQERPTVVLIDEANRAPARAKSALFSALDHRAQVTLDGRGGEVIEGEPMNLITFATINEGAGYQVEKLDHAEKRRYGSRWNVSYLGEDHPQREAQLVTDRTPANDRLAEMLVEAANTVRDRAHDSTSDVRSGVPTSAVINWAQVAAAYDERNIQNPIVKAADSEIVRAFYDDRQTERDEVSTIIKSHLDGAPFESSELSEWAGGADEHVVCDNCGWREDIDTADDMGALDWLECPECDHDLKRVGQ